MTFKKGDIINIIINPSQPGARVKNLNRVMFIEEGDEGIYYTPSEGGFRTFKPFEEIEKLERAIK